MPLRPEMDTAIQDLLVNLEAARKGHFLLESGYHGELWLDLELLCLRPARVQPLVTDLARRISVHEVDAICAPLVEGAFIGLTMASELNVDFTYAERLTHPEREDLYPVEYRIPGALRDRLRGKRVAIVNDVITAGSAVRGTFHDLISWGAEPVAIGALLLLGSWAASCAAENGMELVSIAQLPNPIWKPEDCPLCAAGVPLQSFAH